MESPRRVHHQGKNLPPMARQGSDNCSLTMNSDDLVKSVGSLERRSSSYSCSSTSSSSSASAAGSNFVGNFNLNEKLNKESVDDNSDEIVNILRKNNVGETTTTTLNDFLLRAGVINQNGVVLDKHVQPFMAIDPTVPVPEQIDWTSQLQMSAADPVHRQHTAAAMSTNFNVSERVYGNQPVLDIVYSDNQLALKIPVPAMSATDSESSKVEKRRGSKNEMMEKTIERRQKRMIKNRESAARSRARKQAYTNQLEHEVFQLRKTNSWLKKRKKVEMILSSNPTSKPKYQLRRINSAEF